MKVAFFSSRDFELPVLEKENKGKHELTFIKERLSISTVNMALGCKVVVVFSNDDVGEEVLLKLKDLGVVLICFRAAGYNTLNEEKAKQLGIRVARVPAYSPYAIAEHAVALMMALNRKLIQANNRVHRDDFSLDGLTGFDVHDKVVGVVGTGKIGEKFCNIINGFGATILAHDILENESLKNKVEYVSMNTLLKNADIISLHVPLNSETKYLIDEKEVNQMKDGVMLINTSRGGLINTEAVLRGLNQGKIGYLGLDVYEYETGVFFKKHPSNTLNDQLLTKLMLNENILLTGHQAFLTETALQNIAATTFENIDWFTKGDFNENFVV